VTRQPKCRGEQVRILSIVLLAAGIPLVMLAIGIDLMTGSTVQAGLMTWCVIARSYKPWASSSVTVAALVTSPHVTRM
jgi:ribose/xylose/arabinose/galactoside ABC-type transport system permease subunit